MAVSLIQKGFKYKEGKIPADFDRCVRMGGRVRTKELSGGRYIRICWLNGRSYEGEVKKAKKKKGD